MNPLDKLKTCAGRWQGTNVLQDPHTNAPEESRGEAVVSSIVGGKFIRLDYTWAYQGKAQEGSMLLGYQAKANLVTAHWIDSWHMGDAVLTCQGKAEDTLSVLGSWSAGSGPDWGWRITLFPSQDELRMMMWNITPEGEETLAVEAHYARAAKE